MSAIIFEKTENSFFLVPSELVDRYLDGASELELKLMLYLLRNGGKLLSEDMLAQKFSVSAEEIMGAVDFWVKSGIIVKKNERYSINFSVKDSRPSYSADVIAKRVEGDPNLRALINGVETLFGKMLSPTELNSLMTLYEWDGISPELILLIISHCKENGKKGFKYIEKTAVEWFEAGIDTVEKAEAKIKESERRKSTEYTVQKIIGAENRALTAKEKECVNAWINELEASEELISRAYETTVEKTGKYSIGYMNTVLRSWHTQGIKTVKDIEKDKKPAAKKTSAKGKSAKLNAGKYAEYSWEILKNETENLD
ncbi:MAG: DnaD domain protein [Clostridia bacterium]|nr:DnaD domain protein [Clostridia bacterium]